MVKISIEPSMEITLEVNSYTLQGFVLLIRYTEKFYLKERVIVKQETLVTEYESAYIDFDIVERILKQHYI